MTTRKVFILNKGGHDYSDAQRFGELVYISEGLVRDRFNVNSMYRVMVDAFKDATDKDYILLTSLSILGSIAAAVFSRKYGRVNFLIFKDGKYIERSLDIDSLVYDDIQLR